MRREFADELLKWMRKDPTIWVITCDLGFRLWDQIAEEFPDRFINVGASEGAGMGIAVGLALEGKKPFIYSITPFLIYRAFETIKLYLNGEKIAVRLVGSGRDKDYAHDGPSHDASEIYDVFGSSQNQYGLFWNIESYWPEDKDEIPDLISKMVREDKPAFISLRR